MSPLSTEGHLSLLLPPQLQGYSPVLYSVVKVYGCTPARELGERYEKPTGRPAGLLAVTLGGRQVDGII